MGTVRSGVDLYVVWVAGAAYFALAGLCLVRARRSPLAQPMGRLSGALFFYSSSEILGTLSRDVRWEWAEAASAAMAAPFLLHLVLAFVGARRRHRHLTRGAYAYFTLVALSSLVPLAFPEHGALPGGQLWSTAMLIGVLPTFLFGIGLLVRHDRETGSPEERARTRLFGTAVAIGVGGPSTDLLAHALGSTPLPAASASALLVAALLLGALALRLRMLRGTRTLLALNAALIGAGGLAGTSLVARYAGASELPGPSATVLWGFALMIAALLTTGAVRRALSLHRAHERRTQQLATLGRLSAQMAHDLRNPLAALHGAAQILEEERRRGDPGLAPHGEMIALILEQSHRLEAVVRDYRRLGDAQPERRSIAVASLLDGLTGRPGTPVQRDDRLPSAHRASLDPELITTALENLIRNAHEADATEVVLSAELRGATLVLQVRDDGPGMDARTREQSVESFFTTKAQGSGLGLAFAQRVAEAHGGTLSIDSALGRGTTVSLHLPE